MVALGWDLAAAGVVANGGLAPGDKQSRFAKSDLDVQLSVVDTAHDVERALARGGADKRGADVAVLPLPRFVTSFEHLKALDPVMFLVTGWSSGREVIESRSGALAKLPKKGDIKLGAAPGSSAAFVGLFALDVSGIELSRVKLVAPGASDADLVATERDAEQRDAGAARTLLFGTGDASHLVPFVAVAQRSLLDKHEKALETWARVWLAATTDIAADASTAARRVAREKGAPEPLALLTRLGQDARETLAGNAEQLGLSGRGAVTLESLFQRTWRIWRDLQLLGTPAPERAPLDGDVVAALVRAAKPGELRAQQPRPAPPAVDGGAARPAPERPPLLVFRQPGHKPDVDALVPTAGLLAGVFPRSPIEITLFHGALADKKASQAAVDRVAERYGLAASRLSVGKLRYDPGSSAAAAVLPAR